MTRTKDITLPNLYTMLRDTLTESGWIVTHSNPTDSFIVLHSPDSRVRCVLHFMEEACNVYPDGTWTLKLNCDDGTWTVETASRPIDIDGKQFMADFIRLTKIHTVLAGQMKKDMF